MYVEWLQNEEKGENTLRHMNYKNKVFARTSSEQLSNKEESRLSWRIMAIS
jgi:hypothetical protein